jgi:hypothetical protein
MGAAAREVEVAEYAPATNYQMLIRIYEEAVYRNSRYARDSKLDIKAVAVEAQA